VVDAKQVLIQRQLYQQYESVFKLLDVHKIDLIQKSEIAFYLLQLKEHVFPDLELSKIPNFEQL
jgi:hypothetical protein